MESQMPVPMCMSCLLEKRMSGMIRRKRISAMIWVRIGRESRCFLPVRWETSTLRETNSLTLTNIREVSGFHPKRTRKFLPLPARMPFSIFRISRFLKRLSLRGLQIMDILSEYPTWNRMVAGTITSPMRRRMKMTINIP